MRLVAAFMNSWLLFLGEKIAEETLYFLPVHFNGEQSADEDRQQDLKNIAARARVQVGKGIL
jgi:hypothetical protein